MKAKLQFFTTLASIVLFGNAMAQSITVPTAVVVKGGTAVVDLTYTAGGNTTNFDFTMTYDETVVDEAAILIDCSAATGIGFTFLTCSVDTAGNTVKGIGGNFSGNPLTSGGFASVTLPVLADAAAGDSTNPFTGNFSASGDTTPFDQTWTLTVTTGPQPLFAATPSQVALTGQVGTMLETSVVIDNSGGDALSSLDYTCTELSDASNKFTITGETAKVIGTTETGTIGVACDSTAIGGPFVGTMQCTHNGSNATPVDIPLSCTVTSGPPAIYASTPAPGSTIEMTPDGDVPVGTAIPNQVLAISNAAAAGAADLGLSCAWVGSAEITATAAPATLAPQASADVTFSCSSAAVGTYTGTYTCDYGNAGDDPSGSAAYTVNCGVREAASDILEAPLSGTALSILVPINGTGQTSVNFNEILDEGVDATVQSCIVGTANFMVVTATPATVTAGGTTTVTVTGTDPATGELSFTDTLTCIYTDSDSDGETVAWPITMTVLAQPIPTLSVWGLMLMILTLMGLGGMVIRSRVRS